MKIKEIEGNGGDFIKFQDDYKKGLKKGQNFAKRFIIPCFGSSGFETGEFCSGFFKGMDEDEEKEWMALLFQANHLMAYGEDSGDRYLLDNSDNMTKEQLSYNAELCAATVINKCEEMTRFQAGDGSWDFADIDPVEIEFPDESIEFWAENPELLGYMIGMLEAVSDVCTQQAQKKEKADAVKEILEGIAAVSLSIAALLFIPSLRAGGQMSLTLNKYVSRALSGLLDVCISVMGSVGVIMIADGARNIVRNRDGNRENITEQEDVEVKYVQESEKQPVTVR
ncbi:MAG: hypothetical protein LUD01_00485 [Clostridiales bacterium]|nr:hypothetical protein [Clostridiales bacterium]